MVKNRRAGRLWRKNGKIAFASLVGRQHRDTGFLWLQRPDQKVTAYLQDNLFNIDFFGIRKGNMMKRADETLISPVDKQNFQIKRVEVVDT